MTMYFSPKIGGFLHDGIHEITDDAVMLTDEEYTRLLDESSHGKTLVLKNGIVEALELVGSETWESIRRMRNSKLTKSDWTQLPDADLTEDKRQEWRDYRQLLRDLTSTFDDPDEVIWPTPPAK